LLAFAKTARTGIVPDHVSKVEAAEQAAISGLKGKIIRTPTRMDQLSCGKCCRSLSPPVFYLVRNWPMLPLDQTRE
jgi:hypothetical protein